MIRSYDLIVCLKWVTTTTTTISPSPAAAVATTTITTPPIGAVFQPFIGNRVKPTYPLRQVQRIRKQISSTLNRHTSGDQELESEVLRSFSISKHGRGIKRLLDPKGEKIYNDGTVFMATEIIVVSTSLERCTRKQKMGKKIILLKHISPFHTASQLRDFGFKFANDANKKKIMEDIKEFYAQTTITEPSSKCSTKNQKDANNRTVRVSTPIRKLLCPSIAQAYSYYVEFIAILILDYKFIILTIFGLKLYANIAHRKWINGKRLVASQGIPLPSLFWIINCPSNKQQILHG
ncbi:hypothetical protein DFA_10881 [Cavenderia fasciculata]|uniref:Uncharacterized protein n=1 Tax=Cavenderia fasciculata TaxID=261658 RepID=F4QBN5_CACFS|nr:uncharacterized protein DFA_10881 [Cavenderia fasciculata]EGG14623.1 hypothetical protein DFA_10881 [Cavenderia fasciculata]|eukprot:XP_004351131.1 hypothetical protein DFA_10881 [Cavenderia fasciculata]